MTLTPTLFPRSLTIKLIRDDIESGVPCNSSFCPIALAIWRLYPQFEGVSVSAETVTVRQKNHTASPDYATYQLSDRAFSYVEKVDNLPYAERMQLPESIFILPILMVNGDDVTA